MMHTPLEARMTRMTPQKYKRAVAVLAVLSSALLAGCGKKDASYTAAPPAKQDAVAPAPVAGKDTHRLPPLAGPGATGAKGGGF